MSGARCQITVALAALAAGCVPRGDPPVGRQILTDRHATLVGLLPPTGDGVLRAFITLPSANPPPPNSDASTYQDPVADLYVLSVDSTGAPPTTKLLVPNIDTTDELGCINNVAPCGSIYGTGVIVFTPDGTVQADAITGAVQQIMGFPSFSQDGQRFAITDPTASTPTIVLQDFNGQQTVLTGVYGAYFVGNDFIYVTPQGDLVDIPPSGVAQTVATGIIDCKNQVPPGGFIGPLQCDQWRGQVTQDGLVLMFVRPTSDPSVNQWFIRDPVTGTETAVPFDATYALVSPYGPWLLETNNSADGQFTFFDYRDGVQQEVDVPDDFYADFFGVSWRPGTTQAWVTGLATDTVWILDPGKPAVGVPGHDLRGGGPLDASGTSSTFTSDGAYWFSSPPTDTSTPVLQVGSADDPTGPLYSLNTPDTYIDFPWQLPDDRLLISVYTKQEDAQTRADTSVFDPRTGQSLPLGQRGRVAAVGQTRMLGMFHWDEMRGDLTVFDAVTGHPTELAPEFTVTAFAEPQGADQLAPGTRIVYQFQARTDSPYDGIWVATCP